MPFSMAVEHGDANRELCMRLFKHRSQCHTFSVFSSSIHYNNVKYFILDKSYTI